MAVRIGFICLFVIILISFGTMLGCEECCGCGGSGFCICSPCGAVCGSGGHACGGKCIPNESFCCRDVLGVAGGVCDNDEPFCCPSGTCSSDLNSCPDVSICLKFSEKSCGPICIDENETCCNEGVDTDFLSCPEASPICCPLDTFPKCVNSPDECCDGTGCI